jgi:hypothetical protein
MDNVAEKLRGARALIERLRMKEHRGQYTPGGGTIDATGKGTMWGGEKIMEYRNPDGPQAARLLEALIELVESNNGRL